MKKVLVGFLAVSALVGVSVLYFDHPIVPTSSAHAASVFPVGPADSDVAERYGRIDHSLLNGPEKLLETNPGPAATAAYDTPPH